MDLPTIDHRPTCHTLNIVHNLAALPRLGMFEYVLFKMKKNTLISLGNHFENFVNEKVTSARYSSVSEVIRSFLRLLEREERKERKLIEALEIGEKSGFLENCDSKEHLKELHRQRL